MSKKNKIILLSVIVLFVLVAAIIIWFNANKHEMESESTRIGEEVVTQEGKEVEEGKEGKEGGEVRVKEAVVLSAEEIEEEDLKVMAMSFAERWGSWSTDGDYSNFNSLKVQMTEEMKKFADAEVGKVRKGEEGIEGEEGKDGFYGITTKALSASVKEKTENSAVLNVICQKNINENGAVNVAYAEVKLEMVKEGGEWVVSRIH